jgi:hypothetical protein
VGATDLELEGGISDVDQPLIELLQDLLEKQVGKTFGDLLFLIASSQTSHRPLVEGFRRPSLRSGLLNPSTKGRFQPQITSPLLNSQPSPFVPAPTDLTSSGRGGQHSGPVDENNPVF